MDIKQACQNAKSASIKCAAVDTQTKNAALQSIADALLKNADKIIQANQADLAQAEKGNLSAPLLKRLKFDQSKLQDICDGITSLINIDDPVGKTLSALELDTNLELYKVSSPIGVIGVIFESRPDALVQISTLCLKSSNSVILKGGSEAVNTNRALADVITAASESAGIPAGWLTLLETRQDVAEMLNCDQHIDLIIPRGSNEFVQYIMQNTNVPVLGHADGICHVYIDDRADIDMALNIAVDSKCQYCAVCNAAETLLVHKNIAEDFLPKLDKLLKEKDVEIVGCENTAKIITCDLATEQDWKIEYLEMKISIRIVDNIDAAIDHINTYGSHHTDAIVTADKDNAKIFMDLVDSADVFWNASTRFSDGFRFGLGAEVGISTNKIHARGPVGLEGLLIYKYKLIGTGQTVAQYSKDKTFTHKKLNKNCEM